MTATFSSSSSLLGSQGMFFYQAPSSYYRQPARMYLQYQQPYRAQALRRSAYAPRSAISAYVAGNQVAASGSLLQGLIGRFIAKKLSPLKNVFAKQTNVQSHFVPSPTSADEEPLADEPETLADEIPVAVQNDEDGAVSIAEAYPAEDEQETFADEPAQNDEPVQADAPQADAPVAPVAPVADEVPLADPVPAAAPVAPVLPKRKNKVTVELDTQDDEDQYVAPKKGRPAYGAASNPINTFFPINFGNTQGGAIAVANAYSTGQKGGARSHAIAYGSPASAAKRQRPQKAAAAAPAQ